MITEENNCVKAWAPYPKTCVPIRAGNIPKAEDCHVCFSVSLSGGKRRTTSAALTGNHETSKRTSRTTRRTVIDCFKGKIGKYRKHRKSSNVSNRTYFDYVLLI